MKKDDLKAHYIKVAGTIALAGNLLLACIKFIFALVSNSMALLGDATDSASDVLIAIVTLFISFIISKPGDKAHPWGHTRAETVASLVLAFVIFYAGMQVVIGAAKSIIFTPQEEQTASIAIVAAIISIIGKGLLALLQYRYGHIADSEIVLANAQNMKNDIMLSAGVLLGLALSKLFNCPLLDPIIALLVGLWIIKNSISLFTETNTELMDGNTDNSLYKKLLDAVSSVGGISNPHKARIRKMASLLDIDLDIEVSPEMTVYDAHELAEQVEEAVRKEIPDVYDVVIHIEPEGSDAHQRPEKFGLSPSLLD